MKTDYTMTALHALSIVLALAASALALHADTTGPNPNDQVDPSPCVNECCDQGGGGGGGGGVGGGGGSSSGPAQGQGGSSNGGCCGGQGSGGGHGAQGQGRVPAVTFGPASGLPAWFVSEPYLNLWVRDVPLGYRPAKGPAVAFELRYKQRETVAGLATNVFSVGTRSQQALASQFLS